MKPSKISIFLIGLIIAMLFVSSGSAESFEELYTDESSSLTYSTGGTANTGNTGGDQTLGLYMWDLADNYSGMRYISYSGSAFRLQYNGVPGSYTIPITIDNIYSGTLSTQESHNLLGSYTLTEGWILIDDFKDIISMTPGTHTVQLPSGYSVTGSVGLDGVLPTINPSQTTGNYHRISFITSVTQRFFKSNYMQTLCKGQWNNSISGIYNGEISNIKLIRNGYLSDFNLYDLSDVLIYHENSVYDLDYDFLTNEYKYTIESTYGNIFSKILEAEEPAADTINVLTSVFSTTDNSLIAGANVTYYPLDTAEADPISKILDYGFSSFKLTPGEHYNYTVEADNYRSLVTQPVYWGMVMGDTENKIWMSPISGNATAGYGTLNFYVKTYSDTSGDFYQPLAGAVIQIGNKTLITNDAGYAQTEVLKANPVSYTVTKSGYVSVSRIFTPAWSTDITDEWVRLRAVGLVLDNEPTAQPTTDTRTTNEKAESAFNIFFDNVEAFATMACIVLFLSFIKWMTPKKGR